MTADKLASNSVVSDSIVDGSIVNADVNASAAIAGSKISPDFGSQAIATTGSATIGTDLIHAGDTDTKISFGTDSISLTTNNVTRMTFTGNFIDLPDAGTLRLGNSNDLQISHGSGGASNIVHSNTSQPLKISATGAGNIAFLTNSNERARVDSNGRFLIGKTSSTDVFKEGNLQVRGGSADAASIIVESTVTGADGPNVVLGHSRGGNAVGSGDILGDVTFVGNDGADMESRGAIIRAKCSAAVGVNDMPTHLQFFTCQDGNNNLAIGMQVSEDSTCLAAKAFVSKKSE